MFRGEDGPLPSATPQGGASFGGPGSGRGPDSLYTKQENGIEGRRVVFAKALVPVPESFPFGTSSVIDHSLLRLGGYFILDGNWIVLPATMKAPLPR